MKYTVAALALVLLAGCAQTGGSISGGKSSAKFSEAATSNSVQLLQDFNDLCRKTKADEARLPANLYNANVDDILAAARAKGKRVDLLSSDGAEVFRMRCK
jgi:hypothetical protein